MSEADKDFLFVAAANLLEALRYSCVLSAPGVSAKTVSDTITALLDRISDLEARIGADRDDSPAKREYAAIHIAAALAGRGVAFSGEDVAKRAVELADAVLKEAGE